MEQNTTGLTQKVTAPRHSFGLRPCWKDVIGHMSVDRLYTMKEAAALVGVSPAVLRKWEDRYGLIRPERLANRYRSYSAHEIAVLRWVVDQIQQGTPTRSAIEEARRRLLGGWKPLAEEEEPREPSPQATGEILTQERQRLLASLLQADSIQATRTLDELLGRFQVETVLLGVVEPLLYQIGHLWATGAISEYQESIASMLVRDRLSALRTMHPPQGGPHLLTTCVPGELHELGALIFSLLATRQGFHVTNLGAAPSSEGLIRAITNLRPDAVCMSVATQERLREALPALQQIWERTRDLLPPPLLILGGQGAEPGLAPAGYRIEQGRADEALQRLKRLLTTQT